MKRLLLFAMAMLATLTSWALMPVPGAGASVTEIADEATLKTFITTGGQGKLTADIVVSEGTNTWNLTADVTLDLNDHMVDAESINVDGDYCLTIMDSNTEKATTRYWQLDEGNQWEYSDTETEYTTDGGVVIMSIYSQKFALKSGNVCLYPVKTQDFNISGGNIRFINDFAVSKLSGVNANYNGIMTGGTISYCDGGIVFPKATLLGGTITHNGFFSAYHSCIFVGDLTLGGTIRIEDNYGRRAKDVGIDSADGKLSLSSETPLTTGAHVGLTILNDARNALAGTVVEGATDYTGYLYSSDANFIMNYDAEGQKTELAARQMTQPTAEDPTFNVDVTDCSASDVACQWYAKGVKTLTAEDVVANVDGTWNGTKLSSIDGGNSGHGFLFAINTSGAVTITFDEEPGDLHSLIGNVFTPTSDPKVFTVNTVNVEGMNYIDAFARAPFTVTLEIEAYVAVEGQTTNTLTAAAGGTYVCGVSIRGQEIVSDPVAVSSKTPTAIKSAGEAKRGSVVKTIENGKVVIVKDGEKYDASGRKL